MDKKKLGIMGKKAGAVLCMGAMMFSLSACNVQKSGPSAGEKAQVEAQEMAAGKKEYTANEGDVQVFDTFPEAEDAAGFSLLVLPEVTRFATDNEPDIILNEDKVVEVYYHRDDGEQHLACVRTSKGTEDNTGYQNIKYEKTNISGQSVNIGNDTEEKLQIAWWTENGMAYSLTTYNVDSDTFMNNLQTVVDVSLQMGR